MKPKLRKSEKFSFRLSPDQKAKLKKIADKQDKHPGELVRALVLQEIGRQEAA